MIKVSVEFTVSNNYSADIINNLAQIKAFLSMGIDIKDGKLFSVKGVNNGQITIKEVEQCGLWLSLV